MASANAAAQPAPSPLPPVEAGLGKGITVRTPDDQASLNIRARIQVRSTFVGETDDEYDDTLEIGIRRMRLVFQGNAMGPALTYYVQLAFSNLDTEPDLRLPLRDAYVTWAPGRGVNLRVGQMKVPFSRQRVVSSSALQMPDRSIVITELSLDRDVGLQMFSRSLLGGKMGYAVGIFGGEGRNRVARAAGALYTARLEAWPFGQFDDYVEGDVQRSQAWRVAFGGGVGYNHNTNRPRSTTGTPYPAGDFDYGHAGADILVKKSGWSITSEIMYRDADRDTSAIVMNGGLSVIHSRSGWGGFVQGGKMITDRIELTARYGRLQPSAETDPTFFDARELGGGFSYYIRRHDLKIQADYFAVTDTATGRGVHQARGQFQLFF